MNSKRYSDSFSDWAVIIVGISILLTGIFWILFYDNQTVKDIFGIFSIWITIFGLGLGIDQIAKLKKEKEIIQTTIILTHLSNIKEIVYNIQNKLTRQENIDEFFIKDMIENLHYVHRKIIEIESEDCILLECKDFIETLVNITNSLNNYMQNETNFVHFSISYYDNKFSALVKKIINLEKIITN